VTVQSKRSDKPRCEGCNQKWDTKRRKRTYNIGKGLLQLTHFFKMVHIYLEMQRDHCDDLLFSLPDSLSFEVMKAWLRFRDVVNVDSAYCSRLRRPHLLINVFRSPQYTITGLCSTHRTYLAGHFLAWAYCRGISTQTLLITEDMDRIACRLYLQKFGHSIKRVVVRNISLPLRAPLTYCVWWLCTAPTSSPWCASTA